MGFEIKIFLYIVLGILYLFYKLYRNAVKDQRTQMPKRKMSGNEQKELYKTLREALNLPGNEDHEPVPQAKKPVKEVRQALRKEKHAVKVFAKTHYAKMKEKKEGSSSSNLHTPVTEVHTEKAQDHSKRSDLDFDARKAVIFSEILKRPQY